MIRKLLIVIALFIAFNCAASTRSSLLKDLRNYLNSNQLEQAYNVLSEIRALSPEDYLPAYNSACLAAKMDKPEIAVNDLSNAIELGFNDYRLALSDQELQLLQNNQGYQELLQEMKKQLSEVTTKSKIRLKIGDKSSPLFISQQSTAILSANSVGINAELTIPENAIRQRPEPWFNGGGVMFVVSVPDSNDSFDSENSWRFGFGLHKNEPAGWVVTTPEQMINTRVEELAPDLKVDPITGNNILSITIPWGYIAPYGPPSDTAIGINIHLNMVADNGQIVHHSLIDDPSFHKRDTTYLRYVPVTIEPGSEILFNGSIKNSIVGIKPVKIELQMWSNVTSDGLLQTDVIGPDGQSVVGSKNSPTNVTVTEGINRWVKNADLSSMPQGLYQLVAKLSTPDSTFKWSTPVARYNDDWPYSVFVRSKNLREIDRPTLLWRTGLVEQSLTSGNPRSNPVPLLVTLAETEELLTKGVEDKSLLPESGLLVIAYETIDKKLMPVSCLIPESDKQAQILVWVPDRVIPAEAIADLLQNRMLAKEYPWDRTIVLLPQYRNAADLTDCLAWARQMFPDKSIQLFGRDYSASVVKKVKFNEPEAADNYRFTTQPVESASELIRDVARWLVGL